MNLKTARPYSGSKMAEPVPLFREKRTGAFTLGDLVSVLAMVSFLAVIFLPMLFRAKLIVQEGACLSDLHQIQNGWMLYNNENGGNFPYNVTAQASDGLNWAANFEDYNGGVNGLSDTNEAGLENPEYSLLAPYVRNAAVYRCPADQSRMYGQTGAPRVRSYSMNAAVGPNVHGTVTNPNQGTWLDGGQVNTTNQYTVYLNDSMMVGRLQSSDLLVLVDEHPDSINDGSWAFTMPANPLSTKWVDVPTPLHGNAGSFSFVDGHAVIHAWQDAAAIPTVTYSNELMKTGFSAPNDPDIIWIASHISERYPP
jgi:competence protein ComGC